jgi:pSer/pThr/pTyr-binding forkhead associated (FHA) protein
MFRIILQPMSNPYQPFEDTDASVTIDHFPFVLGRHESCDYQIDTPHISRWHCCFSEVSGQAWLRDLESRNGTFLNSLRVMAPRPVQTGDMLSVGMCLFRIYIQCRVPPPGLEAQPSPGVTGKS